MLLGLKVNRCSQNVMHTISKLVIIIFWPAILFLLLTLDLNRYKKSSPNSTLKTRDSEKERRQKYVRNFQTKDSLQRGEWIQVSNPINPYGFKGCNFSFHSWGKYAAKSMAERSAGVQLWVWKKFWEEYFDNVDVFRSYASRFLSSFGKDRTLLMVGYFFTSFFHIPRKTFYQGLSYGRSVLVVGVLALVCKQHSTISEAYSDATSKEIYTVQSRL